LSSFISRTLNPMLTACCGICIFSVPPVLRIIGLRSGEYAGNGPTRAQAASNQGEDTCAFIVSTLSQITMPPGRSYGRENARGKRPASLRRSHIRSSLELVPPSRERSPISRRNLSNE
jgi:hypothetical protein